MFFAFFELVRFFFVSYGVFVRVSGNVSLFFGWVLVSFFVCSVFFLIVSIGVLEGEAVVFSLLWVIVLFVWLFEFFVKLMMIVVCLILVLFLFKK